MLAELQEECPDTWEETKMNIPGGEIWLNATIAIAGCNAEEDKAVNSPTSSSTSSQPATELATGNTSSTTKLNILNTALGLAAIFLL